MIVPKKVGRRKNELVRIRQIFIPALRLDHILFSSSKRVPVNLRRALELANVVADSRCKLFEEFMNEGQKTLSTLVLNAVLADLENGGSDPLGSLLILSSMNQDKARLQPLVN